MLVSSISPSGIIPISAAEVVVTLSSSGFPAPKNVLQNRIMPNGKMQIETVLMILLMEFIITELCFLCFFAPAVMRPEALSAPTRVACARHSPDVMKLPE